MITALLLSAAGAGLLVGFVFSTIAWLRFRQPDAPLSAVFISALFVASPSYFRPEGQRMRRYSAGSFAVAFMALMILFKLHAPE